MTTAPTFARGIATLTMAGQPVELRCSPAAAAAISRATDGLQNALNRIIAIDYDAVSGVVAAGSGLPLDRAQELVYAHGITPTANAVYQFVLMLLNGGRTEEERRADAAETARGNAATAEPGGAAAS